MASTRAPERSGEIGPVRREIIFEPLPERPAPQEPRPAEPAPATEPQRGEPAPAR
jgi:hypothetical protein